MFKNFKSVDKWSVMTNVVSCAIVVVREIVNDFRISDTFVCRCMPVLCGHLPPLHEFLNNC